MRQQEGESSSSLVALFELEHDGLARLACLLTGSTLVAEDVVQDAFVQLQLRWEGVERPGAYLRDRGGQRLPRVPPSIASGA